MFWREPEPEINRRMDLSIRKVKAAEWKWDGDEEGKKWWIWGKIDRRCVRLSPAAVRSIGCGIRWWSCIPSVWSNTLQTPSLISSRREFQVEAAHVFSFFLSACAAVLFPPGKVGQSEQCKHSDTRWTQNCTIKEETTDLHYSSTSWL